MPLRKALPYVLGLLAAAAIFVRLQQPDLQGIVEAQAPQANCTAVFTFTTSGALASQSNLSSSTGTPCVIFGVTYSSTSSLSATIQFETSPDNSSFTAVPNSLCTPGSSSVQPPCVIFGANPMTTAATGAEQVKAYQPYWRLNVTGTSGTGTGTIKVYGFILTASAGGGGGAAGPTGATGPPGPAPSGTGIVAVSSGVLQTPGQLSGDVTTTGASLAATVPGLANLSTTNAVPFVSSAKTLNQDGGLNMQPTTTNFPEAGLLIGNSAQQFLLAGRGSETGVNGVPYFRSTTAGSFTALDIFPNGTPSCGGNGCAWIDVCNNDLAPLNSQSYSCGTFGQTGKVFATGNGSLVSVVLNGTTAVATTSTPHNLSTGATSFYCVSTVNNTPFPTAPGSNYTNITNVTSTTFTWNTSRTAGTYTTGQTCSFPGTTYIGNHASPDVQGSAMILGGTPSITLQSIGTSSAATLYSSFADGVQNNYSGGTNKIKWLNPAFRFASDQVVAFNSGADLASGSADTGISRTAAGVVGIGTGAQGSVAGTLKAAAYNTGTACSSSASPAVCGSSAAGAVAMPTGVNPTLVVDTTAVTANSTITLTADDSLTIAATTCNSTLATLVGGMAVTARTAGTSFTISFNGTITTNPVCIAYMIVN